MRYVLESTMAAPISIRDAFAVFENPHNLARITPPWLGFEITSPGSIEMRVGAEITYRIRWLGIPLRWKTLISAYEPPFYFVDEQTAGPYKLWRHHHRFAPGAAGATVFDRVEYELPLGWLGRLAHWLIVRRQLEGIFAYRRRALAALFRETTAQAER
jgi:ligand-binding SRPBCC domain-containing protein